MKRVVNCILENDGQILMLKKPKRGWWVAPGGKVEETESLVEAVKREFKEETNLDVYYPKLMGVFNIIVKDGKQLIEEWMLFNYYANSFSGNLIPYNKEGFLEWKKINDIYELPKAEGDNVYLKEIINSKELITGKFVYTVDYELITYSIDRQLETINN